MSATKIVQSMKDERKFGFEPDQVAAAAKELLERT